VNIDTIKKINSYVDNVLDEMAKGDKSLSVRDRIDFAAYADTIRKKLEDHVSKVKKALDFGKGIEIDATFARARKTTSEQWEVDPATVLKEIGSKDFLAIAKVPITELKKIIPEGRFKEIATPKPDKISISFQFKGE